MHIIKTENNLDSASVKACWDKIKSAKGADLFIDEFYQLMFKHHPETSSLFPENLTDQKRMLLAMLDNVINGLEYIDELEEALVDLGQHHKNIGIKKEMFDAFITIIVEAANSSSDYRLTDKELIAWKNAFRKISDIMLKAY